MSELLDSTEMSELLNRVQAEPQNPNAHLNPEIRRQMIGEAGKILEDFMNVDPQAVEENEGWLKLVLPLEDSLFPFIKDLHSADTIPVLIIEEYVAGPDDKQPELDGAFRITYAYETTYPDDEVEEDLFADIHDELSQHDELAPPTPISEEPAPPKKVYEEKATLLNVEAEDYVAVAFSNLDATTKVITGNLDTIMAFDVADDLLRTKNRLETSLKIAA